MSRGARLLLALALGACGSGPTPEAPLAPPAPRASLRVEPATLGVGQVGILELAVVSPPEHQVRPIDLPAAVAGLWLLDVETSATERRPERWIHRTRIRFRPREAGTLQWPSLRVELQDPEGSGVVLETEPLPLRVRSALDALPDRATPFPARALPGGAGMRARVVSFLLGALSASTMALVLARRRRRGRAAVTAPAPAAGLGLPSWNWARAELEAAREAASEDPRAAASQAAAALRGYLHRRFGLAAESSPTEELASVRPPLFLVSRWPHLLDTLQRLDDLRFRPERDGPRPGLPDALERAERFVEETIPPESRR